LHDTLAEAKAEAIRKLREKLALQKRLDYINMLRIENNIFEHSQRLTRAFVFSYFEMMQWLEVGSTDFNNTNTDMPIEVA
jgi:hypothetical protein